MSEEKLSNSKKLDIEANERASVQTTGVKESYKPISEDIGLDHVTGDTVKNSNMVRENGDPIQDGADEVMLGSDDKESLALKNIEVKFISGDQNKNGDAKIDIGLAEKTFTGMTKDELMKYANDPFWVKLRWVLFILFWALWVAMLAGAILIIVHSPKCSAPTPHDWWKKGPLITITGSESDSTIEEIKSFKAQGVIYELSDTETYFVDSIETEAKIKKLVDTYNVHNIHLVLDLTANYVTAEDNLFKAAKSDADSDARLAFVITNKENNWKKVDSNASAWTPIGSDFILSQFENNYDLQMDSLAAQDKLIGVLKHLVNLGVKGFRLANTKHFIINKELKNEEVNRANHKHMLDEYGFWTHGQTIFQEGLGDLIRNFSRTVHNATNGLGFLTVKDDLSARADVFTISKTNQFGFDLPRFEFINTRLKNNKADAPKKLYNGFNNLKSIVDYTNLWMQLPYTHDNFRSSEHQQRLDASAYNMFMMLLPGVPVVSANALNYGENKTETIKKLEEIRGSKVFQHGLFNYTLSVNETAFAYTRVKSGNVGYFVAINPTDRDFNATFKSEHVGSELTVCLLSDDYYKSSDNPLKGKVLQSSIPLLKHSVAIFTFILK